MNHFNRSTQQLPPQTLMIITLHATTD